MQFLKRFFFWNTLLRDRSILIATKKKNFTIIIKTSKTKIITYLSIYISLYTIANELMVFLIYELNI